MTISVDPFATLPSAPDTSSRQQIRDASRRNDAPSHDQNDRRGIDADTLAADRDRSDFQNLLDRDANDRAIQKSEDRRGPGDEDEPRTDETSDKTHSSISDSTSQTGKDPIGNTPIDENPKPSVSNTRSALDTPVDIKVSAKSEAAPEQAAPADVASDNGNTAIRPEMKPEDIATAAVPATPTTKATPATPATKDASEQSPVHKDVAQNTDMSTGKSTVKNTDMAADNASENGDKTAVPHHNENAQKTETSGQPGWGAAHAPRSDRGTAASELKSENSAVKAAAAKAQSSTKSTTEIEGESGEGTAPASPPEHETAVAEGILLDQTPVPPETIPNLPGPAVAAPGLSLRTSPSASETSKIKGQSTTADKSAPMVDPSGDTSKSIASQTTKSGAENSAAPADPQPGATADTSPSKNARSLASAQGQTPVTGTVAAPEVEATLAGIDKRGMKAGEKTEELSGEASSAKGKKTGANPQTVFEPGQHKSDTSANNQPAQPQATTTSPQAGQQPTQTAPAPAMPDLAALTNTMDMSMPRGTATMEVDPVTGALHLTGTGSAKMSPPNLSEVTLQFTRGRMVQTPAKDVAIQIARHLSDGLNRFDIRITPPELGRIEVRLEIAEGGRVTAHLVADKPETLDLLQKDRSTLEKALAEAGLDADESSLKFSMREGKGNNNQDHKDAGTEISGDASGDQHSIHVENLTELEVSAYGFDIVRMKRLDISI